MDLFFDKLLVTAKYFAASALRPSAMTYIPPFYVVRPHISSYANMLIRPSGMMPSMSYDIDCETLEGIQASYILFITRFCDTLSSLPVKLQIEV
jgi:hypothetical protein